MVVSSFAKIEPGLHIWIGAIIVEGPAAVINSRGLILLTRRRVVAGGVGFRRTQTVSQVFNHSRQKRNEHDCDDDQRESFLYDFDVAEPKAGEETDRDPSDAAYNVVDQESPIGHPAHTGNEWSEGSDYRDESGDDDCLATIVFIELVGSVQVLPIQEPHLLFAKDLRTEVCAE